ncbi:MAG: hypothetical protein V3V05_01485 [Pontiella sp.]
MRGHIIAEERFLHQSIDHHLFVTASDDAENEYRFEVRRILPGSDVPETIFEKIVDFTDQLNQSPASSIEPLIQSELEAIRKCVNDEEDIHTHDP